MWPRQRAAVGLISAAAVLVLLLGSQRLTGAPFVALATGVVLAAFAGSWAAFVRSNRAWVAESYRLMGDCLLTQVLARVDAELARPSSPLARGLLQIIRAEALLWRGDFEAALAEARAIDPDALPGAWHRPVWGTQVAALAFLSRNAEAEALVDRHRTVLEAAPGFHQLQAVLALRRGEATLANALMTQTPEDPQRPRLLRAARALFEAEIALALHQGAGADEALEQARSLGGESFIGARSEQLLRSGRP